MPFAEAYAQGYKHYEKDKLYFSSIRNAKTWSIKFQAEYILDFFRGTYDNMNTCGEDLFNGCISLLGKPCCSGKCCFTRTELQKVAKKLQVQIVHLYCRNLSQPRACWGHFLQTLMRIPKKIMGKYQFPIPWALAPKKCPIWRTFILSIAIWLALVYSTVSFGSGYHNIPAL